MVKNIKSKKTTFFGCFSPFLLAFLTSLLFNVAFMLKMKCSKLIVLTDTVLSSNNSKWILVKSNVHYFSSNRVLAEILKGELRNCKQRVESLRSFLNIDKLNQLYTIIKYLNNITVTKHR